MAVQEQNDDLEFQNQLNTLLTDGQSLLNSLQNIKLRNDSNYQSKFFEYLDRVTIVEFICPFFGIKRHGSTSFHMSFNECNNMFNEKFFIPNILCKSKI